MVGWLLVVFLFGFLWFMDDNIFLLWLVIVNCGVGLVVGILMVVFNVLFFVVIKCEFNGYVIVMGL